MSEIFISFGYDVLVNNKDSNKEDNKGTIKGTMVEAF